MSIAKLEKKQSKEAIENRFKNRKPPKVVVCPICNKTGSLNLMNRWHFKNCKNNKYDKN